MGRAGAARAGCRLDAEAAVRKPRSSVQRGWAAATARQPTHLADQPVSYPETLRKHFHLSLPKVNPHFLRGPPQAPPGTGTASLASVQTRVRHT